MIPGLFGTLPCRAGHGVPGCKPTGVQSGEVQEGARMGEWGRGWGQGGLEDGLEGLLQSVVPTCRTGLVVSALGHSHGDHREGRLSPAQAWSPAEQLGQRVRRSTAAVGFGL